jgi:hypothetical protein
VILLLWVHGLSDSYRERLEGIEIAAKQIVTRFAAYFSVLIRNKG